MSVVPCSAQVGIVRVPERRDAGLLMRKVGLARYP